MPCARTSMPLHNNPLVPEALLEPDPASLQKITLPTEGFSVEDGEKAEADEAAELELERKRAAERRVEEQHRQDLEQRREYASRLYHLVVGWLLSILALTTLSGFHGWHGVVRGKFYLPANILMALIGSTTVSVVSIFLIVVRHLFPRRDNSGE